MYMDGFHFSFSDGHPCLLFLFDFLVLNTKLKVALACLATFCIGVLIDLVGLARKRILNNYLLCILYGISLSLAYSLMLLAMTYSIEIFTSVILGLVAGQVVSKLIHPEKPFVECSCSK
jgi:Ctr copper transporter family